MTSPVAFPVGKGSASSTTSLRRSSMAAAMPSTPAAVPSTATDQPGSVMPIRLSAGMGPATPTTKAMTPADAAVVAVMLFSSVP